MLVTVLFTALVCGITGVAVLHLGGHTALESQDFVHKVSRLYAVESNVNTALWRVNAFDDSLASFINGPVSVFYDTTTLRMTISVSSYEEVDAISVGLSEDHHFNHCVALNDSLELDDYVLTSEDHHGIRPDFRFLPEPDLDYFLNNAVQVHTESDLWIEDKEIGGLLNEPGIHVFLGDRIVLDAVTALDVTLVFTGQYTTFYKNNTIKAPAVVEGVDPLPALVFTNEDAVVNFKREWGKQDIVTGAIYCAGKINMKHGEFSGPIICRDFKLRRDIDFVDETYPEFYTWHAGFGNYSDYNWPEHIINWQQYAYTP